MYRITYRQGNGYRCSCCRHTRTKTEDFKTTDEVLSWLEKLAADQKITIEEDDDDREVISIEKEIGVDIQWEFKPRQEKVDELIKGRKEIEALKEKEEEMELEIQEKATLKMLKEKYGK